jgi:hypothetical protein
MVVPKIFQMTRIYNNIFHSKALHNIPALGFLVCKETIWQPWRRLPSKKPVHGFAKETGLGDQMSL